MIKISNFFTAVFLLSNLLAAAQAPVKKPNIIVIFTDDLGYADIGAQGSVSDIKTPNIDLLAKTGIRFTNGYVTAPQCSPSRAGLITGRYQQRYDFDQISDGPLPKAEITIADRLLKAGYVTGQVGKWHLEPNEVCVKWAKSALPNAVINGNKVSGIQRKFINPYMPSARGFNQYFTGYINDYDANFDLKGNLQNSSQRVKTPGYRLETQTSAALEFVKRNHEKPFFLYLAYYGPHVPLEATKKYLDRFPGEMPERRRHALAMMSAIDDGVGQLREMLRQYKINDNTMIVFSSDNGAPVGLTKPDVPIEDKRGNWDGSLNDPLTGEKGMLAEGGIRVPFIINYSGFQKGIVYNQAVSTLDIASTAIAMAGLKSDKALDGVNLVPFLTKNNSAAPHPYLFWRFWDQTAIRAGKWKLIVAGKKGQFLFDLDKDPTEKNNLLTSQPAIVKQLTAQLNNWTQELSPKGIKTTNLNDQETKWYKYYFDL